jgi:hypothetical protein
VTICFRIAPKPFKLLWTIPALIDDAWEEGKYMLIDFVIAVVLSHIVARVAEKIGLATHRRILLSVIDAIRMSLRLIGIQRRRIRSQTKGGDVAIKSIRANILSISLIFVAGFVTGAAEWQV